MFDFLKVVRMWDNKKSRYTYKPTFVIRSSIKDLLVRGGKFYAIYNEGTGLWETRDPKAIELIDNQVYQYVLQKEGEESLNDEHGPVILKVADTSNGLSKQWHNFCQIDYQGDWVPLNQKVIFSNQDAKRSDYCSVKLDYPLQDEPTPYYDKLCEKLYDPAEQEKWEWMLGCVFCGDNKKIQKMLVFYGEPGTGKSTIIGKIIAEQLLCGIGYGYVTKFEANGLTGKDSFGTQFLENDAVVAYDDDAEMQVITSKTTLNKIISHEPITVNPKFGKRFIVVPNCVLIVGSNEPVQLSPNSGMNRRLIDVRPTGNKLTSEEYDDCMAHIPFEKSGIAWRCVQTYKKLGRHYYDHYIAEDMLNRTSPFQNFVVENYIQLKDGISLAAAYKLYTTYAEECNFKNVLIRYKFRDTLRLYFQDYDNVTRRFIGFRYEKIGLKDPNEIDVGGDSNKKGSVNHWLKFDCTESGFDKLYSHQPAQYANEAGTPKYKWENVKTQLKDLDTHQLHYVKVPEKLIVIDFDMKGEDGKKNFEKNLEAASKFQPTYAELSKSGQGIHLHYIWTGGDPANLSRLYGEDIEIKVFTGNSSLRRCLTKCNDLAISELSSGLPRREEGGKKVVNFDWLHSERELRNFIANCIEKKHHGHTTPEMNFIHDTIEDAYNSEKFSYDIRDMQPNVFDFASNSTNKAQYCMELESKIHYCSKDVEQKEKDAELKAAEVEQNSESYENAPIILLDIEVAPSAKQALKSGVKLWDDCPEDTPAHTLVVWKKQGKDAEIHTMLDPKSYEVEELYKYRIVAHNGIGYDSNILYGIAQGYTPSESYTQSQNLVSKDSNMNKLGRFYAARHTFWADTLEYPVNKQKLKLWEIDLGIHHEEWPRPWDQPVPTSQLDAWVHYCKNDVIALEAVFDATQPDLIAKEMLADLAGGSVIDKTNALSTKFVKGDEDHLELVYTDFMTGKQYGDGVPFEEPVITLEEYEKIGDDWTGVKPVNTNHFPGYHLVKFPDGKLHNMFRGVDMGRGGYVYANPGIYGRAVTRDSASHHPSSIEQLNLFGKQTKRYSDLKKARYAIKHKDYDTVRKMFDGKLAKYLTGDEETLKKNAKALSTAFKLVLNAFYGMTSSPNDYFEAKDSRNINNIVALRGAMVLKIIQDEVESRGFKVIHIKTDSIKIADPTDEILQLVDDIGKHYGYTFETEHTWNRICLVNESVFIGLHDYDDPESPMAWDATGKMFQIPYVYKSLFTHEPIIFDDLCATFNTTSGQFHLVFDEGASNEKDVFVGNCGQFTPVYKGNGGHLYRVADGKRNAATGTKIKDSKNEKFEWLESETVREKHMEDLIDVGYFEQLKRDALKAIAKFGDYESFSQVDDFSKNMNPPES